MQHIHIDRLFAPEAGWIVRFSQTSAILAALLGSFVLVVDGFHLQHHVVFDVSIADGVCFILVASALWFHLAKSAAPSRKRRYRRLSAGISLATVSIALISFLQALAESEMSVGVASASSSSPQAGMPHLAALGFILLGTALALPDEGKHDQVLSAQLLATGGFVFGLFGMLAFAFAPSVGNNGLPIEALLLALLALSVLFLHRDRGAVAEVFTSLSGGVMARRLLPVAIVIPVVLDWWRYEAQQFDLLSPETGTMLMVMMAIILLLYETIVTAQTLNRTDASRRRAEEALSEAVVISADKLDEATKQLRIELAERKLAEERVRESEGRLRLIVEQIPAVVWTMDRNLRILSVSGAGLPAANLHPEELIGKTVPEFLGTDDEESKPLAAHRAALGGRARSYEIELAGRTFAAHLEPLHDADGEISGVIAVALDVTEEKRAQEITAWLAAIVESSQDAIMGTSLDGIFTSWNRGAEQLYGYQAEEVLGRHVAMTVPANRQKELNQIFEKVRRGERVPPFETVRLRKDGQLIDVSIAVSPVKDGSGSITGVSAIVHDISDRKRVERELRTLSARLLKMQDEERRNIARELHDGAIQELAAAVINLSMVKEAVELPPEPCKALDEAVTLVGNTVREIRTFSYLLHPPLLEVTGLASALRWYVEGYSRRSGIHVELDLPENHRQMGKEVELTLFRIVQEALANIHRHSGGKRATIRLEHKRGSLTLSVADDGHGMDAATLEKVTSPGAALGVGIAGMKERLRQLGGHLEVTSSNCGTIVTAALPPARKRKDEALADLNR